MTDCYTLGQVFTPGGRPTITYNPRAEQRLEETVRDYLDERFRILSISGPTKTGKTVLLRNALPEDAVWLSGGTIRTDEDFWVAVADGLASVTRFEDEDSQTTQETDSWQVGADLKLVGGNKGRESEVGSSGTRRLGRDRRHKEAARHDLRKSGRVVVVDDFHYIGADTQLRIVQGLKDLIFDGVGFVVAAVPHRAYDVIRVEKEMTGRVEQLPVGFWKLDDLVEIATKGFDALNARENSSHLAERLAKESFQSPHLMQEFCRELCKANDVRETGEEVVMLEPPNWEPFFRDRASQTSSRTSFELLARGPRQRSDRKLRELKDGRITDIYTAILAAVAATGPQTELTYEQVRAALREVMKSEPPQRHEVTRVLDEMTKIARETIPGEPVVDYDDELATLYISDPYFAYYLRWGPQLRDL